MHYQGYFGMGWHQQAIAGKILPRIHPLDVVAAWLTRRQKLFSRGWGDEAFLTHVADQAVFDQSLDPICVEWANESRPDRMTQRNGTFLSPLSTLPAEVRTAHVRAWIREGNDAACVVLAASRDEGYKMRERVFGPLVNRGVDLYLLENPFYGRRRTQSSASLHTFSDHVLMNLASVWEAKALLQHLLSSYGKLAVAGYSMGGHMAAITAAVCPFPVACAALATGASAAPIYTQGLLSWSVDLRALAGGFTQETAAQEKLRVLIRAADLTRYSPPLRSDAAVLVGCARDGYVLPAEIQRLHDYWPNSTLRWLQAGHVTALIRCRHALRAAVADATAML